MGQLIKTRLVYSYRLIVSKVTLGVIDCLIVWRYEYDDVCIRHVSQEALRSILSLVTVARRRSRSQSADDILFKSGYAHAHMDTPHRCSDKCLFDSIVVTTIPLPSTGLLFVN